MTEGGTVQSLLSSCFMGRDTVQILNPNLLFSLQCCMYSSLLVVNATIGCYKAFKMCSSVFGFRWKFGFTTLSSPRSDFDSLNAKACSSNGNRAP